jgi:hypothetical protein
MQWEAFFSQIYDYINRIASLSSIRPFVSADLKGIHFSRFQGEPDGGLMSPTHTGTLAAFGD